MAAEAKMGKLLNVPKVSVKQITDFPVDSNLFEVHGRVIGLDSPTQEQKPGLRALPFGNLLSMAAILHDKDGGKITVEAQSKDQKFLQGISNKLKLDATVMLYRPVVTSCRYSLTDQATSLRVEDGRTVIIETNEKIDKQEEEPVPFDALQPGGVHKLEGLLVYKSRISKPATTRGERDVAKIVIKDKNGVMGGIAFWGEQAHLSELRDLRARADVIIITGVQYDEDQGCSSTRNTTLSMSTLPAPEIAGVGLTYKVSTVEKISAWSRVVQSLMGSKWMTTIILGTFIDFEKIDSIVYGCYNCGSSASRNPVTYEMYCDNACEAGTLKTASIEITTTVNIRVDGGPDTLAAKIWPNDFVLVTGMHLESFSTRPPSEQLEALNVRFKNRTYAMHPRVRENPNTQYNQYQANVVSLELPPQFGFFNKKYKAE